MATSGGPDIVRDGLVFGMDTGYGVADRDNSTRFYQGSPSTNLWDSIDNTQSLRSPRTSHYWNGKKWIINNTFTHPGVEGPQGIYIGKVFKFTSGALNSSWSNNSYGYMLRDIATTSGQSYTVSCWCFTSSDCDIDSIPTVIEGESGGETTVSGYNASYSLSNKGTWQRLAKKATADGNVRFIPVYPRHNGVTDGSFSGFFMWAAPQVILGSAPVPYIETGTSRSSTQSLIDLTKTTDIDVSNVSFDSTGQPTFDGTDDSMVLANPGVNNQSGFSIELVIKPNNASSSPMVITPLSGGIDHFVRFNSSSQLYLRMIIAADSSVQDFRTNSIFSSTEYHHVIFTFGQSEGGKAYYNGTLENSSSANFTALDWTSTWRVGQRGNNTNFYQGELPVMKVYDRALSAQEVQQNYNAYKNRFDI